MHGTARCVEHDRTVRVESTVRVGEGTLTLTAAITVMFAMSMAPQRPHRQWHSLCRSIATIPQLRVPSMMNLAPWESHHIVASHLGFYSAFPDIGNSNFRYRGINFRYREMISFPISGNDFQIYRELIFGYREICLISRHREINSRYLKIATREASHSGPSNTALPHRPSINNGPQPHRPQLHVETVITTSVKHSVHTYAIEN